MSKVLKIFWIVFHKCDIHKPKNKYNNDFISLAKIRESKLAKRNWWFWIWQKSCQHWKCSNMSILRQFREIFKTANFLVFISLMCQSLYLPFLFFVGDRGCDCVDGPWKHFYFYKLDIHMKYHSVHDSFVYDARIELEDMFQREIFWNFLKILILRFSTSSSIIELCPLWQTEHDIVLPNDWFCAIWSFIPSLNRATWYDRSSFC